MALNAFSHMAPHAVAIMMEGRSSLRSLSIITSPLSAMSIIAWMSAGLTPDCCNTDALASFRLFHHISGSCSCPAHLNGLYAHFVFGKKSEATVFPVTASTRAAFTDELPMSYPSRYIFCCFINWFQFVLFYIWLQWDVRVPPKNLRLTGSHGECVESTIHRDGAAGNKG